MLESAKTFQTIETYNMGLGSTWLACLALAFLYCEASAQNYCSLCANHTMCIYKGVGPACAPRLGGGVTEADKVAILKIHNDLRQRVAQGQETLGSPGPQPPAADMRVMAWDEEVASVAQRLADQCRFGHDSCRRVARFGVGQNIAWVGGSPDSDWPAAVRMWYAEVKDYSSRDVNPFRFSAHMGHYTQVVWAGTHLLGCGYSRYRGAGSNTVEHLYVCNYAPAGNVIGQALYQPGTAASRCPLGTARGYPGLCS